jgi:hypothetical protein
MFMYSASFSTRKFPLCLVFLLLFLIAACAPVTKQAKSEKSETPGLNTLLELNDLNERAFAYHNYCLRKTEPMNEKFLENFKESLNLLFDECLTTGWKPDYIVSQIVKRREQIQQTLSNYYLTKGCQSAEAVTAHDHYRAFSILDKEAVGRKGLNNGHL